MTGACEYIYHQREAEIDKTYFAVRGGCFIQFNGDQYDGPALALCQMDNNRARQLDRLYAEMEFRVCQQSGCDGDYNQDGTVDVDDLLLVINGWGIFDTNDIIAIANTWGACE